MWRRAAREAGQAPGRMPERRYRADGAVAGIVGKVWAFEVVDRGVDLTQEEVWHLAPGIAAHQHTTDLVASTSQQGPEGQRLGHMPSSFALNNEETLQ